MLNFLLISKMSNQIFVILPSNTPYPNNGPNKFTIPLPKTLDLSDGNYVCGLHSISYVYGWPQVGTLESQWIEIFFKDGYFPFIRIPVPEMSFDSEEFLETSLMPNIKLELKKYLQLWEEMTAEEKRKRVKKNADTEAPEPIEPEKSIPPEEAEKFGEIGFFTNSKEAEKPANFTEIFDVLPPIHSKAANESMDLFKRFLKKRKRVDEFISDDVYFPSMYTSYEIEKYVDAIKFFYVKELNKFKLKIADDNISHIGLSPQLGYILGFNDINFVTNQEIARFSVDPKAGINSFGVYVKGLTENIICGNQLVSLMRIVTVNGKHKHGDTVEKIYDSPIFLRVQPKTVNTIEVELRTMGETGRLLPFVQNFTTIITLVFKKVIVF